MTFINTIQHYIHHSLSIYNNYYNSINNNTTYNQQQDRYSAVVENRYCF